MRCPRPRSGWYLLLLPTLVMPGWAIARDARTITSPGSVQGSTATVVRSSGRASTASVGTSGTVSSGSSVRSVAVIRSGQRSASVSSPRTSVSAVPPINGTNVSMRVPVASRRGDSAPGTITRGFGPPYDRNPGRVTPLLAGTTPAVLYQPQPTYGGVAVNPAAGGVNRGPGVTVNPSQGGRGPAIVGTTPYDRFPSVRESDTLWYRRYRDRYKNAYESGGGCYEPIFTNPYYSPYGSYWDWSYWTSGRGDVYVNQQFVNGPLIEVAAPEPVAAEGGGNEAAAPEAGQAQAPEREGQEANRDRGRSRRSAVLSEEKLRELMIAGVKMFEQGKYDEAASVFLRVTLADRQNIDATLAYAVARFASGDYQIAALAVRRAVRRMPEVVNSSFDVRSRYGHQEDFANHLVRLEGYVAEHPEDEDAWLLLGFIRHFSGQRELAVQTFDRLKALPGADLEVADIFLDPPPAEPVEGAAARQPAPVVLAGERPLPGVLAAEQLISIEPVE